MRATAPPVAPSPESRPTGSEAPDPVGLRDATPPSVPSQSSSEGDLVGTLPHGTRPEPGVRLTLLTGATGYVGGRLLRALEARSERVRCLVRRPEELRGRAGESTEIVGGDVFDPTSLRTALAGNAAQITAFLFPALVLISLLFTTPLTFALAPVYICASLLTAIALWQITGDGEATRFEGAALISLYVILAVVTFFE